MESRNDTESRNDAPSSVLDRLNAGEPQWRRTADALGDEIATLAAQLTAAEYRLLCKIREFDACDGWYHHGARSCAHWLNWRIGLGPVAARERVRVARALGELPRLSAAMERGALSYSKARALTRIATPENEQVLLDNAMVGTASHIEKMVRLYRQAGRPEELRRAAEQQAEKYLRTYWDDDGMLVIEARLPTEEGALVEQALEAARRDLFDTHDSTRTQVGSDSASETENDSAEASGSENDSAEASGSDPAEAPSAGSDSAEAPSAGSDSAEAPSAGSDSASMARPRSVSWSRQCADALVHVAEAALAGAGSPHAARAQVTVHVDAVVLADVRAAGRCELEDGAAIAADTMRRLSCDADILTLLAGKDGEPLGPGRRSRRVTSRLRRALAERDRGCAFPGCSCQRFLHAHHIRHWADGGATELGNLIMLCLFHHRLVHEGGFSVDTSAGGPRFRAPGGEWVVPSAVVPAVECDPVALWRGLHDSGINAYTTTPDWEGDRPDYEEMLRPMFEL